MFRFQEKFIWNTLSLRVCSFLFFLCVALYFSNGILGYNSGDNVPNTLLIFNLLENHTIHLDALRETHWYAFNGLAYYALAESDTGHLTSAYPIGTALLTAPLYVLYYWIIKLTSLISGAELNIFALDFESYRLFFEKLTSVLLTSASASILFLLLNARFSIAVSFISSFIFAFATNTWFVSSQALWQHTAGNFSLILCIFLLIKSRELKQRNHQEYSLLLSGIFCGLLPAIRPSSLLFFIALIIFCLCNLKKQAVFFCLGSLSILLAVTWNFYYFQNFLSGGYGFLYGRDALYEFTIQAFLTNINHLLLSASRGLFVYSPVLLLGLFGIPSLYRYRAGLFEKLVIYLFFAGVGIFASFCFYRIWWGGYSFGPRLLVDLIPIFCIFVCYGIDSFAGTARSFKSIYAIILSSLITYSVFVQFVGIAGERGESWNSIPLSVDLCPTRVGQWNDHQIERYSNAAWNHFFPPALKRDEYLSNLSGRFISLGMMKSCESEDFYSPSSNSTMSANPVNFSAFAGETVFLKSELLNTGKSRWYGYKTAVRSRDVKIRASLQNAKGELEQLAWLYVRDSPKNFERAIALGSLSIPATLQGKYKLVLELFADSEIAFSNSPPLTVPLSVLPTPWVDSHTVEFKLFENDIQLINGSVNSFSPGEEREIKLWVKNRSNFGWPQKEPYPVRLSCRWLYPDGKQVVMPEIRGELPFYLPLERSAAVKLHLIAPNQPGKYRLLFSAVQEDVAWFIDNGATPLSFDVVVSESE